MKNLSLILNAILLAAVGILYYLHFKKPNADQPVALPTIPSGAKIIYVNTDSLLDGYSYFKNKKDEFEKKNDGIKSELSSESERLQRDAAEYQKNAPGMTNEQRAKTEDQLMARQQNLMKRKESLLGALDDEQSKFHDSLYTKLNEYLREYNKGRNYSFVLGYSKGGGILFANDSLDATKLILEGLNKRVEGKK